MKLIGTKWQRKSGTVFTINHWFNDRAYYKVGRGFRGVLIASLGKEYKQVV